MYAAIDIGGTKTLVAVMNSSGKIVEQLKFPTPHDYTTFTGELRTALGSLKHQDFQRAVVAVPGKVDRKRGTGIAFGNLPWRMVSIGPDIEQITHCPVRIENDAKLAALSEAQYVLKDFKKSLYITISTGINGGLIINGVIDPSFEDMELGQILLEYEGSLKRWEEFASGKAFQEKYASRVGDMDKSNSGAWYWFARNIAIGMIDVIATLTPQVIIVGGGAGSHLEKFYDRLVEELKIYENPLITVPPIIKAKHPEEAVIYGCYYLAKQTDHAT